MKKEFFKEAYTQFIKKVTALAKNLTSSQLRKPRKTAEYLVKKYWDKIYKRLAKKEKKTSKKVKNK